jgi:hypothetical protein
LKPQACLSMCGWTLISSLATQFLNPQGDACSYSQIRPPRPQAGRGGKRVVFSPAISDNESFNSPSRGWHWASIYADAAGTFASTTGLHTRFECRRIVCWDPKCPDGRVPGNIERFRHSILMPSSNPTKALSPQRRGRSSSPLRSRARPKWSRRSRARRRESFWSGQIKAVHLPESSRRREDAREWFRESFWRFAGSRSPGPGAR